MVFKESVDFFTRIRCVARNEFICWRLRQNSEETKRFVGIIRKFRTIVTIDVQEKLLPCG